MATALWSDELFKERRVPSVVPCMKAFENASDNSGISSRRLAIRSTPPCVQRLEIDLVDAFCAKSAANAFEASKATTASAQVARAAQWVLEGPPAAPRRQHDREDEADEESDKYDDQIQFILHERALRSVTRVPRAYTSRLPLLQPDASANDSRWPKEHLVQSALERHEQHQRQHQHARKREVRRTAKALSVAVPVLLPFVILLLPAFPARGGDLATTVAFRSARVGAVPALLLPAWAGSLLDVHRGHGYGLVHAVRGALRCCRAHRCRCRRRCQADRKSVV